MDVAPVLARLKPHRYDAVVICYHDGFDDRALHEVDRRPCATMLGADFSRRFRCRTMPVMSYLAGNLTLIAAPGESENVEQVPEWYEKLWPPLYWLRARWDGLRFGFDRDRRP